MRVVILAAVATNGVIGNRGRLPWHLPEDLARFKRLTMGHTMVMGRRTFDSIGKALPGRTTVVVTRQSDWTGPSGVFAAASLEEALELAADEEEVFVVGGEEIFRRALGVADVMELTEVRAEPEGDAFFPAVDWSVWQETDRQDRPGYSFVTYRRVQ